MTNDLMGDLVRFRWRMPRQFGIAVGNHRPDITKAYAKRFQTWTELPVIYASTTGEWVDVAPLEQPNVIQAFDVAEISPTQILDLVGRYGLLTGSDPAHGNDFKNVLEVGGEHFVVEALEEWENFTRSIHEVMALHRFIRNETDGQELDRLASIQLSPLERERLIGATGQTSFEWADKEVVHKYLTSKLELLRWNNTTSIGAVPVPGKMTFRFVMMPNNLQSAIWLYFLQVIVGKATLHQCPECGEVFSHRGHRDIMYCSQRCRLKASRKRKKEVSPGSSEVQQLSATTGEETPSF